jgi:hypothetical protein
MRASFHGQNILALGHGIARLQTPHVVPDTPEKPKAPDPEPPKPHTAEPKPPHQ